jgi:surface polysaccharide O-acyltransferase-like enzyme
MNMLGAFMTSHDRQVTPLGRKASKAEEGRVTATKPARVAYLDALRTLAIFAVILIHVLSNDFWAYAMSSSTWIVANVVDGFFRFAAPVFVMISGALLLDAPLHRAPARFYWKHLPRILIPLAFWGLFYQYYVVWADGLHHLAFPKAMRRLYAGTPKVMYHLWFLYMILGIYAAAPFIKAMMEAISLKSQWLFFGIWFLVQPVLLMIQGLMQYKFAEYNTVFGQYVGYFVLGSLLHRHANARRSVMVASGTALWLLGSVVTAYGTIVMSRATGTINPLFPSYVTPNVVVASTGIFLMIKGLESTWRREGLARVFAFVGKAAYGIYLTHILFLDIAGRRHWLLPTATHPLPAYFINAMGLFLCSLALTVVIGKIPVLRRING